MILDILTFFTDYEMTTPLPFNTRCNIIFIKIRHRIFMAFKINFFQGKHSLHRIERRIIATVNSIFVTPMFYA